MRTQIKEKILLYKVVANQDKDAYAKLYDFYIEKIYRFVFLKVRSKEDAEDLTSDIFLKTWKYLLNSTGEEVVKSFSGLIYRIARNSIIDYYRSRAKNTETPLILEIIESIPDENANVEKYIVNQEAAQIIASLKKLKEGYQEVILLRYTEELSIKEIASILNKKPIAIRVTLHRALKKLKELTEKNVKTS